MKDEYTYLDGGIYTFANEPYDHICIVIYQGNNELVTHDTKSYLSKSIRNKEAIIDEISNFFNNTSFSEIHSKREELLNIDYVYLNYDIYPKHTGFLGCIPDELLKKIRFVFNYDLYL